MASMGRMSASSTAVRAQGRRGPRGSGARSTHHTPAIWAPAGVRRAPPRRRRTPAGWRGPLPPVRRPRWRPPPSSAIGDAQLAERTRARIDGPGGRPGVPALEAGCSGHRLAPPPADRRGEPIVGRRGGCIDCASTDGRAATRRARNARPVQVIDDDPQAADAGSLAEEPIALGGSRWCSTSEQWTISNERSAKGSRSPTVVTSRVSPALSPAIPAANAIISSRASMACTVTVVPFAAKRSMSAIGMSAAPVPMSSRLTDPWATRRRRASRLRGPTDGLRPGTGSLASGHAGCP